MKFNTMGTAITHNLMVLHLPRLRLGQAVANFIPIVQPSEMHLFYPTPYLEMLSPLFPHYQ